jgi:hypothetical protein
MATIEIFPRNAATKTSIPRGKPCDVITHKVYYFRKDLQRSVLTETHIDIFCLVFE